MVAGVVVSLALHPAAAEESRIGETGREYNLTALSQGSAATVLTLEPGVVGLQNFYRFTPKELQGYLCAAPNTCRAVDYATLPGDYFNELGADKLITAVSALPADGGPVILMGHSQGGQVIYSALRRWEADPANAPDPARVSWVSIGNPDNPMGGKRTKAGDEQPLPTETPYAGTEVIRQYDGWADWPDDSTNLLAVFNAVVGMSTVHPNYFNVDINDPANVRYTPDLADGTPGNVTYVWVPNPVLPLVAGLGPLGPVLDPLLRPTVEAGYNRPVQIPAPGAVPAAAVALSASATVAADVPSSPKDAVPLGNRAARRASAPAVTGQRDRADRPRAVGAQTRAKSSSSTATSRRSK